ncbi:MAG: 3-dehydroquinate synthase [Gammaproteobacteria bacterium]|nr:MAG: 3-dehydroquinate synthase [Gammaproteobacteria bacterium]
MPRTLTVDLGERSYPIFIGPGILNSPDQYIFPYLKGKDIMVVSNETVAPLYLDRLMNGLRDHYNTEAVVLPDGEQYKTLESVNLIFDALLANKFGRDATLVALGGGVVGDMTGFAAACYQRGIDFLQIPTTLLSQVDSSVGGKTGVNHPLGKNMIGAFHQPRAVLIDIATLSTLEMRHYRAGLAEVIKYGLIEDCEFFVALQENIDDLLRLEQDVLVDAIETSCRIKAEIVADDERESGRRAILNLGHTFGHAIETATGYSEWLHGEAIACGMVMAADLSERLGWLARDEVDEIRALFQKVGLPTAPPSSMTREGFIDLMSHDKKVVSGQLRLVLLKTIGQAIVSSEYDQDCLDKTLDAFCKPLD